MNRISLSRAMFAGLVSGLVLTAWNMLVAKLGLSTVDLGSFDACMISGVATGNQNMMIGLSIHFIASLLLGIAYAIGFSMFWKGRAGVQKGLILSIPHWLFSATLLYVLQGFNPCIAQGSLPLIGWGLSAYGIAQMGLYLFGHMLFGALVGLLYRPTGKSRA